MTQLGHAEIDATYGSNLSNNITIPFKRYQIQNGFNIAMKDLEIRGAGDLLGGEQSGFINEMGFETYQKILDEAINELKENDFKNLDLEKNQFSKKVNMVFETDLELMFPNDFINSSKERLNLYTKLNKIIGQDELDSFKAELIDRFGTLPNIVDELLKTIELRWLSAELGFDKIVLKKNILIGYIKNFDSEEQKIHLDRLFKYSLNNQNSISFSQKKLNDGEKFVVKIQKINSISKAIQVLSEVKD